MGRNLAMCMVLGVVVMMMMMMMGEIEAERDQMACLRACSDDCDKTATFPILCKVLCTGDCPPDFPGPGIISERGR
ncbi:hypothetical protein M5689_009362 [Euphorbia peplus]|nr:hypothetical protein M5689_009362 [Euphorbia peplus]